MSETKGVEHCSTDVVVVVVVKNYIHMCHVVRSSQFAIRGVRSVRIVELFYARVCTHLITISWVLSYP